MNIGKNDPNNQYVPHTTSNTDIRRAVSKPILA